MDIIREISLQAIQIMTLVFGILGMTFSLLLLFAPRVVKNLSGIFNRSVNIEKKLAFLDKDIRTEKFFYGHPVPLGLLLAAGSVFGLLFFFFNFDIAKFAQIFFGAHNHTLYGEMVFQAIAWVGRIGCLIGLVAGLALAAAPNRLRAIERKLDSAFETRPLIEILDRSSYGLDTLFFRYPFVFGLITGSISCLLIVLSILNLLR